MRYLFFIFAIFLITISLSGEWTVIETFSIPEGAAGLAWDGEYLYCGIYGTNGDQIYQIDPSDGSWQYAFSVPDLGDCFGLTCDGSNLWTTDHPGATSDPAIAIEVDMNGNVISQFNLPDHYMSGIAYDNGDFWVSTYYDPDGYIYKLDADGSILQEFTAPDNQPWDLCMEGEYLWMADYWGDALYKIDPSDGSLIESHTSEGVDPAGIVFDGQYIWYCDNGEGYDQDYLYKVDLGGEPAGTVQGYVYDAQMEPLEGVLIEIGGNTTLTDVTGFFTMQLIPGAYSLEASLEGYFNITQNVIVIDGETTEIEIVMLTEDDILPPRNVTADEGGLVTWEAPAGALWYNIYLDNNYLGSIEETSIQLNDLEFLQYYEFGISACYNIAESEIVTVGFIYTGYHQYGDVTDSGDISAYDAANLLQYVAGLDPQSAPLPWEDWRLTVADVQGNQTVDAYDAVLILQYTIQFIDVFPVELPGRYEVPIASADIRLKDGCLIISSEKDLYALTLLSEDGSEALGIPQMIADNGLMFYNMDNYKIALASPFELKGDFLVIPVKDIQKDLHLTMIINNEPYEYTINFSHDTVPSTNCLLKNYPNPFNPETNINFQIAESETGKLDIFNTKGQMLLSQKFGSGFHSFKWQVDDYSSGIYFYRLTTKTFSHTAKMSLIK